MSARSHRSPSAELLLGNSPQRHALLGASNAGIAPRGDRAGAVEGPDGGDLEQLQRHAMGKCEETTSAIRSCIRVAEDMKQQATQTMVQLHEQGQQIRRTHETALVLEQELHKGEKLLASLGGIFSRPWRPKRGHELTGPMDLHNDVPPHPVVHLERTELFHNHQVASNSGSPEHGSTFQSHVQEQRATQDEALSDLSSVLDQLKDMSFAMGTELESQNQSLSRLHDDVSELEFRVKNANAREEQLLRR